MGWMGGTEINYPEQQSYADATRESLMAQIELAPQLFAGEASQAYGRPAYAQLETDILRDTLLGAEGFVPEDREAYARAAAPGTGWQRYVATAGDEEGAHLQKWMGMIRSDDPSSYGGREWVHTPEKILGDTGVDVTGMSNDELAQFHYEHYGKKGGLAAPSPATMTTAAPGDIWGQYASTAPESANLAKWKSMVQSGDPSQYAGMTETPQKIMQDTGLDITDMSDDQLAQFHYEHYGAGAGLAPPPVAGEYGRTGGLLELMGGRQKQAFTTGEVDPKTGQMVPSDERRAGFAAPDVAGKEAFLGLSQYGADISQQAARQQRGADIGDVQALAPAATTALRAADPLGFDLLGTMGGQAKTAMGQIQRTATEADVKAGKAASVGQTISDDYGGLLGTMQTQAASDLAAGRGLTPRQLREAQQGARAGWEARGMIRDPGAVVGEVESVMEARGLEEAKRRDFAQRIMAQEAARRGEGRALTQATMGASQAMSADPFMAILGRPSGASQQVAQTGLSSAGYGLSSGPQLYSPESGVSYMLGQQQNQANLAAAQAAASATKQAGLMQGLGAAASAIPWCWIAREVYGESNPRWKRFREWMLNDSPAWFLHWYLTYGETVAEWISDKPELKARIRVFMDSKVEG